MKVPLPKPVADIYRAVEELNILYGTHKRKFTPDGHLVGSIGEVIAAELSNSRCIRTVVPGMTLTMERAAMFKSK